MIYSLPMAKKVKGSRGKARGPSERRSTGGSTRVSSKHQVTIPAAQFRAAGLREGDVLNVEADGTGRISLIRVDELADRYSGALDTGGELREVVEELRGEWR